MALGKKVIVWEAKEMLRGMSTSAYLDDGGFSPDTTQANLTATPGIMFQPAVPTDKSTNVIGEIIASAEDPQLLGSDRVFIDDEGHYYTWNGTTVSLARTDATNPSGYTQGKTDCVAFDGSVFTTTTTTLVKWTVDSVFTDNFQTGYNASYPHPLLVYRRFMYLANGNVLLRFDNASDTSPDTVLTLDTLQVIVALGVDPGSGKMLISTTQGLNTSATRSNSNTVMYYDGSSPQVERQIPVDGMVTAFPFTEGQLYVAYNQNLGLWNGAGITFLRKMDITFSNERLMYKQHFTSIDSTLYVIENTRIIAHGPIQQGGAKVFYPLFKNGSTTLTHICNLGQGVLGYAYATDKFFTLSTTSVATSGGQDFFSNQYHFDNANDGMWIRRVRIFYKDNVASGGLASGSNLLLYNENGLVTTIGNGGFFTLENNAGASQGMKEILIGGGTGTRFYQLRFEILLTSASEPNPGIERIEFFGEPANQT